MEQKKKYEREAKNRRKKLSKIRFENKKNKKKNERNSERDKFCHKRKRLIEDLEKKEIESIEREKREKSESERERERERSQKSKRKKHRKREEKEREREGWKKRERGKE